jgi:hypothetical protein
MIEDAPQPPICEPHLDAYRRKPPRTGLRVDAQLRGRVKQDIPNLGWPLRFWAVPPLQRFQPGHRVVRVACVVGL